MIRAGDRVAAVLAREPRLLEVLVSASPAFAMLRNAATRKTMARLVTIEQAARIAGIETAQLLARLNGAFPSDPDAEIPDAESDRERVPEPARAAPAGLLETPEDRLVDVDVREDLRAGREPLRKILDAVQALTPGQVLRVRATFEPAPLYAVLGKRGLASFTEHLGNDDWRVWFFRSESPAGRPAAPAPAPSTTEEDGVIVLDVRGLEPPEPLQRTLEALAALPRGGTLVQLNVRVPQFLLPKLEERGFAYEIRVQSTDLVRLVIRHKHP